MQLQAAAAEFICQVKNKTDDRNFVTRQLFKDLRSLPLS